MSSLKPLEARVQSFSVLCIPTGDTHITSDMCAGIHISRGCTYHCDTAITFPRDIALCYNNAMFVAKQQRSRTAEPWSGHVYFIFLTGDVFGPVS